ncbi:FAD/NAD(P)-binding protein [Pararcticibacter amylolyticus]|uniref:FAD-dependent urate hydroxylase HpyO/Asp monooxygenase CreE-like FAD/NAD(P)-binding domain-containing protein n=1 Tax=Pararcticibacter amylolyticus TaxID=2173175 RepID=A0A2U2PLI2_9SPHI|nr:FAD/NAD(P)-binding protein [Pararcticibacter amylolyticus]PWG82265.1 hypothetical protein DDR33_02730 [Pararcticibacter amylolyticus]
MDVITLPADKGRFFIYNLKESKQTPALKIAIIGGGPSALFMYKRLTESGRDNLIIDIYEKGNYLGAGMPYSSAGANDEHITNVSGNEIPEIFKTVSEWIGTVHKDTLRKFRIDAREFNEYKTLPRLLFGQYLSDQFKLMLKQGDKKGLITNIHFNSIVTDIADVPGKETVEIFVEDKLAGSYDKVIICTGHLWPHKHEGEVPGYYDSPYPPSKLNFSSDHQIAIRGSSLTAIDAIRTLARNNGEFENDGSGNLVYHVNPETPGFGIVMHSRNGMLPALRFHLDDSHQGKGTVLDHTEISAVRKANDGFLPLDYVFERNFRAGIREKDPEFYEQIRDLSLEEFVEKMMELRERLDPFLLLAAEYSEAAKSIKRRESVYWKEMLGVLSFTMNYPAKYFSAEDMIRLQRVLMPLISIVIAYIPQSSAAEMLAMHKAGCLDIVAVGRDSYTEPGENGGANYHYTDESGKQQKKSFQTFIDCIGQPHLSFEELPFPSLAANNTVSRARLYFRKQSAAQKEMRGGNDKVRQDKDGKYYLIVPGISINDSFQAVDEYNALNERIYVMAVPFIGGFNPDYSGLDFGEAASAAIVKALFNNVYES